MKSDTTFSSMTPAASATADTANPQRSNTSRWQHAQLCCRTTATTLRVDIPTAQHDTHSTAGQYCLLLQHGRHNMQAGVTVLQAHGYMCKHAGTHTRLVAQGPLPQPLEQAEVPHLLWLAAHTPPAAAHPASVVLLSCPHHARLFSQVAGSAVHGAPAGSAASSSRDRSSIRTRHHCQQQQQLQRSTSVAPAAISHNKPAQGVSSLLLYHSSVQRELNAKS